MWGAVLDGYLYMKGSADVMAQYEKMFQEGLLLLKNMTERRQTTDTYGDQGAGTQQG